jgi:hypothetical protein
MDYQKDSYARNNDRTMRPIRLAEKAAGMPGGQA